MAGQVPAVNGRYVLRLKRLESLRVVPVEKVAVKFSQFCQTRESQFLPFDKFQRGDVAQVICRNGCERQQADICRRSSMGKDWGRVFLKIIRRQPVVFGANESLKETPGAARYQACKLDIVDTQKLAFWRSQPADPVGDEGRKNPDRDKRRHHAERRRPQY